MNIYTVQTPKACPLIGIFCMYMQKNQQVQQAASSQTAKKMWLAFPGAKPLVQERKNLWFFVFGVWGFAPNSQGESQRLSPAQGIVAEILLPQAKDWSG
jgi:hypothetical protein